MPSALKQTNSFDLSSYRRPKREAGYYKAVEMLIEPGAEKILEDMGRLMRSKARSKVIDAALTLIRENYHISEVKAWFSEPRFAPSRRTTIRISNENAQYLSFLAALVEKGRPTVLLDMVYFAAVNLSREDIESLRD